MLFNVYYKDEFIGKVIAPNYQSAYLEVYSKVFDGVDEQAIVDNKMEDRLEVVTIH